MLHGHRITVKQRILNLSHFLPLKQGITLAKPRNPLRLEVPTISAESGQTQFMAIHTSP